MVESGIPLIKLISVEFRTTLAKSWMQAGGRKRNGRTAIGPAAIIIQKESGYYSEVRWGG